MTQDIPPDFEQIEAAMRARAQQLQNEDPNLTPSAANSIAGIESIVMAFAKSQRRPNQQVGSFEDMTDEDREFFADAIQQELKNLGAIPK